MIHRGYIGISGSFTSNIPNPWNELDMVIAGPVHEDSVCVYVPNGAFPLGQF